MKNKHKIELAQSRLNPVALPGEAEAQPAGESKTMTLPPQGSMYWRLTALPA